METPILATSRLRLREVAEADAGFVFALMNEPAYHEFIGDRGIRTIADAARFIREKFQASYRDHGYGLYLVERKDTGGPVGICGFVRRDTLAHPDIGFALLAEHWRQGYGGEAAAAVLEHGFTRLGFQTILGVTSPDNRASIRLLEKLGLRFSRMERVPPRETESMVLSISKGAISPEGPRARS